VDVLLGTGNRLLRNSVHSNGLLGIDVGSTGAQGNTSEGLALPPGALGGDLLRRLRGRRLALVVDLRSPAVLAELPDAVAMPIFIGAGGPVGCAEPSTSLK
jgi:hypothetical protein